jgi:hypothetical protein
LQQDFFLVPSDPVKHVSKEAQHKENNGIDKKEPSYKTGPDLP